MAEESEGIASHGVDGGDRKAKSSLANAPQTLPSSVGSHDPVTDVGPAPGLSRLEGSLEPETVLAFSTAA